MWVDFILEEQSGRLLTDKMNSRSSRGGQAAVSEVLHDERSEAGRSTHIYSKPEASELDSDGVI